MQGHAFGDGQPESFESAVLGRVVRHETDAGQAEVGEDLGADAVFAAVDGQAQFQVGVDGVESGVLEFVGAQFVGDADASAFVSAEVDDDAVAVVVDAAHCFVELGAAVAFDAGEHVTGDAFAVDSDEHVGPSGDVAFDERQVGVAAIDEAVECVAAELSPLGG